MRDDNFNFLVSVHCSIFNHSSYIKDALQGFVSQQTEFPFICILVDDASTDDVSVIIKSYLRENFYLQDSCEAQVEETDDYEMLFSRHKENKKCFIAYYRLKYNHWNNINTRHQRYKYVKKWENQVKYIAVCEGDDYWIDVFKLQRQVDFLEQHPDYSMCFHAVDIKVEKGRKAEQYFGVIEDREYKAEDIIKKWIVPTCSIVYRAEIGENIPKNPHFVFGDDVLYATCLSRGRIYGMSNKMGVYRLVPSGWMANHSGSKRLYSSISQRKGLMEEFPFYRCDLNYKYMENTYYKLLFILLKGFNFSEFKNVAKDYKETLPMRSLRNFPLYIIKSLLYPIIIKVKTI